MQDIVESLRPYYRIVSVKVIKLNLDKFKNAFSGLWWAVATLTTVGYGDIYPITVLGRVFGAVIAILGIGMVAIPTGIISSGFMEHLQSKKEQEDFAYCPYCGKKLRK